MKCPICKSDVDIFNPATLNIRVTKSKTKELIIEAKCPNCRGMHVAYLDEGDFNPVLNGGDIIGG